MLYFKLFYSKILYNYIITITITIPYTLSYLQNIPRSFFNKYYNLSYHTMQFVVNESTIRASAERNQSNSTYTHTHICVDFKILLLRFFFKILNCEHNQISAYVFTSHISPLAYTYKRSCISDTDASRRNRTNYKANSKPTPSAAARPTAMDDGSNNNSSNYDSFCGKCVNAIRTTTTRD